ncbi:hypothetical protein Vadar_027442 [Vaccinium darrowii]|uniref:Uncharacterized protein n=1 Tax=Vaccinium darrowii TaxID=229202 RepID=A0ACB7ZE50_9ERIC|nr:hypothetical protein Vadar_027442 [Vaccinium darrowii]
MHRDLKIGVSTEGQTLAHRAITQGYWWPNMEADDVEYARHCDRCQCFAPITRQPAEELNPLESPWSFAQWGIDLVSPLTTTPGGFKHLITATDYFTKWIEAKSLVHITDEDVKSFLWKNIFTRFGSQYAIVSDNGMQFTNAPMEAFLAEHNVRFYNSQCNGQAESTNKTIAVGIKRRLMAKKGKWMEELYHVLVGIPYDPSMVHGTNPLLTCFWDGGRNSYDTHVGDKEDSEF